RRATRPEGRWRRLARGRRRDLRPAAGPPSPRGRRGELRGARGRARDPGRGARAYDPRLHPRRREGRGSPLPQGPPLAAPAPDPALRGARHEPRALGLGRLHARGAAGAGERRGPRPRRARDPRPLRGRPHHGRALPRGPRLRERALDRRSELLRPPRGPLRRARRAVAPSRSERLFAPIRIGALELRNRIVLSPMTTDYGTDEQLPSPRLAAYLEERARGGAALLVLEACSVDRRQREVVHSLHFGDDSVIA